LAKLGKSSRSFLRYRENVNFLGELFSMRGESKKDIIEFMYRFNYNDRSIYFAENIQILTQSELLNVLDNLTIELNKINANGIIEFHPTADGTSKSAHIHYWGEYTKQVDETIKNFIKNNRLSNKEYLNYTNSKIKDGTIYKVEDDKLNEYSIENDELVLKSQEELDESSLAIDNMINEELAPYLDELELTGEEIDSTKELNLNEINNYILEQEIELNGY
jgi:hypothetical protein